ncbi:hypothetical protein I5G60_gp93 [Mycobacterium phage Saguaro]|uniref:Uncharacterized protein n=1 Tax=Mycobacterium phage Saguaro TaxID=2315616 RepID=A0A386KA25_9CAUD|nr:hypothetical protein I5G60_gp93 [Mycobacterium phage Saguaro]AYD82085.1 hypothetical protein SEA_SAGUARO_93 [Mycobacterium phage Saguaro]
MATVTFTATHNGETFTRTSGTMPYVAVTVGSQVQWHKSFAAAHKAAVSRVQTYSTGVPADVVPVTPTAINGNLGDWTPEVDGWGDIPAEAFAELVAAKRAGKKATAAEATEAPVFKSHKGGEYRATVGDTLYRVRKTADAWLAQRKAPAGWITLAEVDSRAAAEQAVADLLAPAPVVTEVPAAIAANLGFLAPAPAPAKVEAPVAEMNLVRVEGKPQARLDTVSGKLVWRNSTKGRAARAVGLWT